MGVVGVVEGVWRSFLSDAAKRHRSKILDENTDPLRAKLAPYL
jgi:hypothetical protein